MLCTPRGFGLTDANLNAALGLKSSQTDPRQSSISLSKSLLKTQDAEAKMCRGIALQRRRAGAIRHTPSGSGLSNTTQMPVWVSESSRVIEASLPTLLSYLHISPPELDN